ncbi:MAG: DegV family protein [Clostridia bacterium]|nr:DegV family protein [Clostridia bacterium]
MTRKIKITSDSTCDLGEELCVRYDIDIAPLHIVYGDKSYDDMRDITPADIVQRYRESKQLPKTSAVSVWEYTELFKKYVDDGYEVVHISLGSSISSSHQNACTAAQEVGRVYVVDSQNLSSGMGLLVLKAAGMVKEGVLTAEEIAECVKELSAKVSMSFVLDDLEFLRAGGRCSMLAALGANLLSIKPCIEVDNTKGASMTVGRKYRGKLDRVVPQYTREKLSQFSSFDNERAIIVSRDVSDEILNSVCEIVESLGVFKEIMTASAGCTITSHCGPGTIGITFLSK